MKVNNNEQRGINKKVIAKTIIFLFGVLILLMIRVFLKINLIPSLFISLLFVVIVLKNDLLSGNSYVNSLITISIKMFYRWIFCW